ncbi:MAG: hypothetical protein CMK09_08050 [Ponticaulis sp.]|nr:hypothetical protein [Ponticaulis sp.]
MRIARRRRRPIIHLLIGWAICVVALSISPAALAQENTPVALDYNAAELKFLERSDAIAAASDKVNAMQAQERSTRHLHRPDIDFEFQLLEYQKTLYLPLGSLSPLIKDYGIPDPLVFRQEMSSTRPIFSATLPIYTGGEIAAAKDGARAQVDGARAEQNRTVEDGLHQLVSAYFGQQLAERVLGVRRDVLSGLEQHLKDVTRMEDAGLASRAQRLQAEVARDEAKREYENAIASLATANVALAGLLRSPSGVRPLSPLSVISEPLRPVEDFKASALATHPELMRLQAITDQADAGVRQEISKQRPQVYGFAQYNLDREDALLTDPDWMVGVGFRYKFLSGVDRKEGVASARAVADQARAGRREARIQIEIGVTRSWFEVEAARKNFLLLDSAIASAKENLRLQRLAYSEQQATSLDVIDAQLGLGRARIQQTQAAYDYIVALADLLSISGKMLEMPHFLNRADRVVP